MAKPRTPSIMPLATMPDADPAKITVLKTPTTELFKIKHLVILAGMNAVSSPRLCAAVTNAGGLGVIGGGSYTPEQMAEQIDETRQHLDDPNAPFGVDLLLPNVGGGESDKVCMSGCQARYGADYPL